MHIFDIFNCYPANINGMWNAGKLGGIFFRLEGHVTVRNVLTPLWNEGKARSVNSYKLTATTRHFCGKKQLQDKKPTLWIKLVIKIKFWHTYRFFRLNLGTRGAIVTRVCPVYLVQSWCSIPHYGWVNGGFVDVPALLTLQFEAGVSVEKSCSWWSVNLVYHCSDLARI